MKKMIPRMLLPLTALALAALPACGGGDEEPAATTRCGAQERYNPVSGMCDKAPQADMSQPAPDMNQPAPDMNQPTPDMNQPTPDMNQPAPDMNQPAPDMSQPQEGATLVGRITRSAAPDAAAGGDAKGTIYVGVFTESPVTGFGMANPNAMAVAREILPNADLSAQGASLPYRVTGIPPRQEPYYIVAFLDDNASVNANDPTTAAPDRGDLVSLKMLLPPTFPTVELKTPTEVSADIDLSAALPF